MTRYYLDSSVAVHAVMPGGSGEAAAWIESTLRRGGGAVYSSTLLGLELVRVLRREKLLAERARAVTDRIVQISIDDGVLRDTAAIEPHLKSLDAVHLATCALIGLDTCMVTHDVGLAQAARAMGFGTFDPLRGEASSST